MPLKDVLKKIGFLRKKLKNKTPELLSSEKNSERREKV